MPPRKRTILTALAVFATATSPLFADMPGIIPASPKDLSILDTNNDGLGDTLGSMQATEARVGENTLDAHQVRYCVSFVLNDDEVSALRASAAPITFHIRLTGKLGATGASVLLLGLPDRNAETFVTADFHAPATEMGVPAITDASPGGKFAAINVSSFVQQELAKGLRTLAFRMEYRPHAPNSDSTLNRFIFGSADSSQPPFLRYQQ